MLRKERVYLKLKEMTKGMDQHGADLAVDGFSAGEIADSLSLDRTNVSRDLNMLVSEGRALKLSGRPVRFLIKENNRDMVEDDSAVIPIETEELHEFTFHNLVGAEGSLKAAVQQAKASILYPGNSLNILLTGATGVGKTTFGELIYRYAREKACIDKDGRFIIFNCSEYADNPQLLLDQLFGHVKGAFTGAESDKAGLIEKAEGGVLLLDEIHRLTPEGQEMLFMFIDKGKYRRLGESETIHSGNVMLVAATTEDPESSLLKTFTRRFPMMIKLPALDDRPVEEKYEFIKTFFQIEARGIKMPVEVDEDVMFMLLSYPCAANIGQLRADIQLICARGFLEYVTEKKETAKEIYVGKAMLPQHILDYFARKGKATHRKRIDRIIGERRSFYFSDNNDVPDASARKHEENFISKILDSRNTFFENVERAVKKNSQDEELSDMKEIELKLHPKVILTTCITGEGAAVKIAERINDSIPDLDRLGIKLIPLDLEKSRIQETAERYANHAIAVVGTVELDIPGVPFISLEDWILNDGTFQLKNIVTKYQNVYSVDSEYMKVVKLLKDATVFIDGEKVYREATKSFDMFDLQCDDKRRKSLQIRFLLHVACMLERIIQKLPIQYPNLEEAERIHSYEFRNVKKAVANIENNFCVDIPDNEIGFIVDLIYTQ